jgi:hypothetical protein
MCGWMVRRCSRVALGVQSDPRIIAADALCRNLAIDDSYWLRRLHASLLDINVSVYPGMPLIVIKTEADNKPSFLTSLEGTDSLERMFQI